MRKILIRLGLLAVPACISACVVAIRDPQPLLAGHVEDLVPAGYYADEETFLLLQDGEETGDTFCMTSGGIIAVGEVQTLPLASGDVLAVFSDVWQFTEDWRRMPGGFPFIVQPGEGELTFFTVFGDSDDEEDLPPFLSRCTDASGRAAERFGVVEVCMAGGTAVDTVLAAADEIERVEPLVLALQPETTTCEALIPAPMPP